MNFYNFCVMNPIKILFFALSTILGLEEASIVSRKASCTINAVEKTIDIFQEDLFSIVILAEDSIRVVNELQHILDCQNQGRTKIGNGLTVESIRFSNDGKQINAAIKVNYDDAKTLMEAGIYLDTLGTSGFSLIDIPEWNMRSPDALLKERYWLWPTDRAVTFVMEPFNNIPGEYVSYKHGILAYWEKLIITNPSRRRL